MPFSPLLAIILTSSGTPIIWADKGRRPDKSRRTGLSRCTPLSPRLVSVSPQSVWLPRTWPVLNVPLPGQTVSVPRISMHVCRVPKSRRREVRLHCPFRSGRDALRATGSGHSEQSAICVASLGMRSRESPNLGCDGGFRSTDKGGAKPGQCGRAREVQCIGYNVKIIDMKAAMGHSQIVQLIAVHACVLDGVRG